MGLSKRMFEEMNPNLYSEERSYIDAERQEYERQMFQEVFQEDTVKVLKKVPRIAKSSYLYKRKLPEMLWNKLRG